MKDDLSYTRNNRNKYFLKIHILLVFTYSSITSSKTISYSIENCLPSREGILILVGTELISLCEIVNTNSDPSFTRVIHNE